MNRRGPMNDAIRMQISAFVDGELPQNEAELLLRRMCQDRDLRQQAAEYLAMGRVMRGERSLSGAGKLRERISAALDDQSLQADIEIPVTSAPRFLRPVAGVAIAATVALAALLGLQQLSGVPGTNVDPDIDIVADENTYIVPQQDDDQLREYFLRHSASASYWGANNFNSRLVTLQLGEVEVFEPEAVEEPVEETENEVTPVPEPQTP